MTYGILLVSKEESRGTDMRFYKDAIVLILANIETYS